MPLNLQPRYRGSHLEDVEHTSDRPEKSANAEATVLLSGGIDSAALLGFYLRQQFNAWAVFVDFGQPAAKQESYAARAICKHYGVRLSIITVKSEMAFSSGEIPGRNAFLVFAAVLVCGTQSGIIAIGIHEGPPYYDCSEGFLRSIQTLVDGYAAGRIKIAAPLLNSLWKKGVWRSDTGATAAWEGEQTRDKFWRRGSGNMGRTSSR